MDKKNKSDIASLVKLAQKKDAEAKQAMGQLIESAKDRVFRYCFLMTHRREMAEDLCQEAFIRALQKIDQLDKPGSFVAWVCLLAKNIYIDQLRLHSSTEIPMEEIAQGSTEPNIDDLLTVRKILSQFEPEDRNILVLIELEGLSYKETSEMIGISEDALRSRLHRLRQDFAKILKAGETK